MPIETILVVDDEPLMRSFLAEALRRHHYQVAIAENGKQALALIKNHFYDLVLTDLKMPDLSGLDIVRKTREVAPHTMIIVMTAYGTIENAVEAMRLGAFHYLLKPFTPDSVEAVIQKASQHVSLMHENTFLREEINSQHAQTEMIVESAVMKEILELTKRVAKSCASVLIHGESGTGKEVIARAIHNYSLRAERPYIRVNCAAIPDTLIESEFFGHEKGAFTGASSKRIGRFELADGGTILLDEVTEIPISLQPKLLRVIQEQEFERVGGSKPIAVDVRIISTSNRDLEEAISQKVFRQDLLYRLKVVPLYLPPLRERRDDILPLAMHFLNLHCHRNGKPKKKLKTEAKKKLLEYPWPGNIRELANVMERLVVLDFSQDVEASHLNLT